MAGAQSLIGGGELPGLQLVAWVLWDSNAGAIKRQFGVSAMTKQAAGKYTITLSAPMADSNPMVLLRGTWKASQTSQAFTHDSWGANSTTQVMLSTYANGTAADIHLIWVGIYQ